VPHPRAALFGARVGYQAAQQEMTFAISHN